VGRGVKKNKRRCHAYIKHRGLKFEEEEEEKEEVHSCTQCMVHGIGFVSYINEI